MAHPQNFDKKTITYKGTKYGLTRKEKALVNAATTEIGSNVGNSGSIDVVKELAFASGIEPDGLLQTHPPAGDPLVAYTSGGTRGYTISASSVVNSLFDTGAPGSMTMSAATAGNYVVYRCAEDHDAANAFTIGLAGTDKFEPRQALRTNGLVPATHDISAADGSDTKIVITPDASNSAWGEVGSDIHFYCRTTGKWRVKIGNCVPNGTGAAGSIVFG